MKALLLNTLVALSLLLPIAAFTGVAAAACPGPADTPDSRTQVLKGIGETGADCTDTGVFNTIQAVVTIISIIAGVAAVIMVILSGFRYITSGGDSGKVGAAKSSLIYALVGIAVASLAQLLVHFVLNQTEVASNPCKSDASISASDKKCK